jgi:hypothetical protein
MLDWEYALRASYLKAGITYYTGFNALAVHTPGNVTSGADKVTLNREAAIGKAKYGYPGDRAEISRYSKVKIWTGKTLAKLPGKESPGAVASENVTANLEDIYTRYYELLEKQDQAAGGRFII